MHKNRSLIIIFAALLAILAIADLFNPEQSFSAQENRFLTQKPRFTINALLRGDYTQEYESYVNDQFIMRNAWIRLKAISESFLGKQENNGIIYGREGYSFAKRLHNNDEQLTSNAAALYSLQQSSNAYIALIPSAPSIIKDKLPAHAPVADEKDLQASLFGQARLIDLFGILSAHSKEYIYYRTDHHWTTLGAYYAYTAIAEAMGLEPLGLDSLEYFDTPDFLGSHYRKTQRETGSSDTIRLYSLPFTDIEINNQTKDGLYDLPQLAKEDKYAALLYGNNALTVIKSPAQEGKKGSLLLIKDSFGNSLAPFFLANYESVTMLDLRYFNAPISAWLAANQYDDILALYNFESVQEERSLYRLGK